MPFTPIRVRSTPATLRRDDNVRRLIAAMRERKMLRSEIQQFLGASKSGAGKYIAMLRNAGVIVLDRYVDPTSFSVGHALYRVSDDAELVDGYLKALGTNAAKRTLQVDPTRTLHRLSDDSNYKGKQTGWRIPAPDPVLAAFFGLESRA